MAVGINATGSLSPQATGAAIAGQEVNDLAKNVGDTMKSYWQYQFMGQVVDLQTAQMNKYYESQGHLMDLNSHLSDNQKDIAFKQFDTMGEIASLQKDRDIAVANARAGAAVKIARVNALNSQFYGQPVQQTSVLG